MLFRTSKWVLTIFTAGVLFLLLIPDSKNQSEHSKTQEWKPARLEMAQKQALVDRDMALTEQLCRQQCSAHLNQLAHRLSGFSKNQLEQELEQVRRNHPHIITLIWKDNDGQTITSGGFPAQAYQQLASTISGAEQALIEQQHYESERMATGTDHYLVLAASSRTGDASGIIGVIRQSIIGAVEQHQIQNLRLVPYPSEGNYKIESVDSDTHRDIHVDNGEENAGASHYHKQQVVVKFYTAPTTAQFDQIKQELDAKEIKRLGYTFVVESRSMSTEQMLAYFRQQDQVEYVEPHYLYLTNQNEPNDDLFAPYQWNLPLTHTLAGWSISKGSDEIMIAVLDTGVDLSHPDLNGRLGEGINVVRPEAPPQDDVGHGTHVAGVISAAVNNGEGVAGMTWYDKVMPIKVLDDTGAGSTYTVAEGLIWAADHGAKVINMSLGNYAGSQFLHDAIRYAYDKDVVLIAATGNDNTEEPGYPAAYPEVFAVSAIDEYQERAPFSNYGNYVDVVAPGVSIASTYPHNQYAALSGTSMASPHAAALAALIRSVNPLLKNTEVMDIMRNTAVDLGPPGKDPYYGFGMIDVAAALEAAARMKQSVHLYPEWVRRDVERIRSQYERGL